MRLSHLPGVCKRGQGRGVSGRPGQAGRDRERLARQHLVRRLPLAAGGGRERPGPRDKSLPADPARLPSGPADTAGGPGLSQGVGGRANHGANAAQHQPVRPQGLPCRWFPVVHKLGDGIPLLRQRVKVQLGNAAHGRTVHG